MSDTPTFELPPPTPPQARPWWLIATAMLVAGAVIGYIMAPHGRVAPDDPSDGPQAVLAPPPDLLTAAQYRTLGERLERNQLFAQAAEAWLAASRLEGPAESARADRLYRIGKNLHMAGQHDRAVRYLFAAEAAGPRDTLKTTINSLVLEGLSALGLEEVRDYQALQRASLGAAATTQDVPDELARIGNEPITERDLMGFARRMVDLQLRGQRAFLSPDALEQAAADAMARFDAPQARQALLQNFLRDELLYREALAHNMPDRIEVRQAVVDSRRSVLIEAFVDYYLRQSVQIDDAGLQDAYEANKQRYVEPEAIRVEAIVAADEPAKDAVTKALEAATDFNAVRSEHSAGSGEESGDAWVARDGFLPGVSDVRAVLAHLFTLEPGQVSDRWFEGDGGAYRYRVVDHRPTRQLELDQCRDRVEQDLRQRKQQQAIQTLQTSLAEKYDVSVSAAATQPAG